MADGAVYITFGGDTDALEASLASAKAAVSSFTSELSKLAREQVATGASAESELGQKMLAVAGQLTNARARAAELSGEMQHTAGAATATGAGFATLSEALVRVAEIAGIAWSVDVIKNWIAATTEASEKIEQFSAKLGASPEQVQQLQAQAKLSGVDFDEMASQLERMQLQLARVDAPSSRAGQALHALGIDAKSFAALSMAAQLERLAEATSRFADGGTKTAAMEALLGRAGADMIPYLDRGREAIEEHTRAIEAANVVMSGPQVAAFARTEEDLIDLGLAWWGLSQRIYSVVNLAIDAAIKEMTRLVSAMNVSDVRAGVESLTDTAIDLAASIEAFAVRASSALGGLGRIMANLAKINNMTPGELNTQALKDLFDLIGGEEGGKDADAAQTAAQKLTDQLAAISKGAEDAKAKMHALYASGGGSPYGDLSGISFPGAGKPSVPQMDLGGGAQAKQAAEAARQAFADEVEAAQDAAKGIETTLDNQLKQHQITMLQWLAQTNAALDAEAMAVINAADKAVASAALSAEQRKAIWTKEAHDLQAIADQEANAQAKAAEQSAQQWKSAADTIAGAMNSQVDGLLRGTETMRQAFAKMAESMIEDAIKWTIKAIAEQGAVVAAHVTGATAIAAADQSAGAAGALSWIGSALHAVEAAAAQTFAGVTAFMAPTVGPAAPAFGAAAMGTVTAVEGMLYDTGAWSVPQDMITGIHAGEMVVPQRGGIADEFRSFMATGGFSGQGDGGGDVHVHFNVNGAVDGQSFINIVRQNIAPITSAISSHMNSHQNARPKY